MFLSLKEVKLADEKNPSLNPNDSHSGWIIMFANGDGICLHCLETAKKPIPLYGWTAGECDEGWNDGTYNTEPPDETV